MPITGEYIDFDIEGVARQMPYSQISLPIKTVEDLGRVTQCYNLASEIVLRAQVGDIDFVTPELRTPHIVSVHAGMEDQYNEGLGTLEADALIFAALVLTGKSKTPAEAAVILGQDSAKSLGYLPTIVN